MAKEELEEYEEEEEQEEECLDATEMQIRRLDEQMDHISKLMCKVDPLASDYDKLSAKLEALSRTKANLEEGRNAKAQQQDTKDNRFFKLLTALAPVGGAIVGETIKQRWEMKKLQRVTDYEKSDVITTKAMKWCK